MKWWLLYNLPGLLGSIPLYSMVDRDAYQPTGIVQWDGTSIFYGMELPKKQQRPLCLASRSGLDKSLVQLPWKHHWAVVKTPSCLMIMGDYTTHCNGKTIHEWDSYEFLEKMLENDSLIINHWFKQIQPGGFLTRTEMTWLSVLCIYPQGKVRL